MKVWIYAICFNEVRTIRWFLNHYATFADRIIIFDEQSTDGTREFIKCCPNAEIREWPYRGLDDEKFTAAVNTIYKEARGHADWVMWSDIDELLYHPRILDVLSEAKEDMVLSTGYALISKDGEPQYSHKRQVYDLIRSGFPQPNYDKLICWRPSVDVVHTIGRHSYPGQWPRCNGVIGTVPKLKLFHCHHFGGVEYTEKVNSRNFSRAVNKRYAWNYTPEHNRVEQVGSAEWIRDLIDRNLLYDVVTEPVRKLNFGCGGNRLEGWENFDIDVDISKPLPFPDECARFILAEHCVEHVSHQDAWMFFKECHRILQPGGVLRVAIPDVCRMERSMTPEYSKAVRDGGHGSNPIRAAVFEHGHRAAWDQALLGTFLCAIGFKATAVKVGESEHGELRGVEGHWKVVGESIARVETSVVEGTKA